MEVICCALFLTTGVEEAGCNFMKVVCRSLFHTTGVQQCAGLSKCHLSHTVSHHRYESNSVQAE